MLSPQESNMRSQSSAGVIGAIAALFIAVNAYAGGGPHVQYRVVNLGDPLGGAASQGTTDGQPGWVAGWSVTASGTMHAELWRQGVPTDLGTLGGPSLNSAVAWPNRNQHGVVVGIAETDRVQPEYGAPGRKRPEWWSCYSAVFLVDDGHVCRGFIWRDGSMIGLPTLGGPNGFATGVNDRDQVVGWAENNTHDPTCGIFDTITHQVLQFEAVMWVPDRDDGHGGGDGGYRAIELPPYPGDLDGAATAINQRGEVVGISGICDGAIGGATAQHMVVWKNGRVLRELPALGGAYWNTPMDINDRGDVAGFVGLGDDPYLGAPVQAFFWSRRPFDCGGQTAPGAGGTTCGLGALAGDGDSEALGVNNRGQVVGVSFGASHPYPGHAFIWQDGRMRDLNDLVVPGSTMLTLSQAEDINDRGEITGQAYDPTTQAIVAFEAIPVR